MPPSLIAAPNVRVEYHTDGGPVVGLGTGCPRLSWTVPEAPPEYQQSAYEISILRSGVTSMYWTLGSEQVLVPWPTTPLASREAVEVRVRVARWDRWSPWSEPVTIEAGLLDENEWSGRFVSPAGPTGSAPVFHGSVSIEGRVARARLYATAHGVYVPTLNGVRVGDRVLAPGWTAYEQRLEYQTYDVTDLVVPGVNKLEVLVGNGWYRGRLGFEGGSASYGDRLALLVQLEVETVDGRTYVLATDADWRVSGSAVLSDDLYDGQHTDLRPRTLETGRVDVLDADLGRLSASSTPPVRVTEVLPSRQVWTSPSGRVLVDFGQVVVGWVRLHARGLEPGAEVAVRHAEVLEDSELGSGPLRSARATDSYVVAGGEEVLEPSLTFHGFRYAEITGLPGLAPEDVEAVVVGSDLRRAGWFESSNELLNRFHDNVVWSMRGNFLSIPTDCPQRDERLGWTGDIQVFAPTALFLFDSAGFLNSWLTDLALEQHADGSVPFTIPDILRTPTSSAAAWGDAAVVIPWTLYERTGDVDVLERQLASMRAWVDHVDALAGPEHLWSGGFQFGDWLDPTAPNDNPYLAQTDPDVVATACFARSAAIVARAAAVLDRHDLARQYGRLAEDIRTAFVRAYVTPSGRVHSDSQTAYALAIAWDLLPTPDQRRTAGERLADLVRVNAFRIGSGFVGTPLVPDALVATGHADVAHRLVLQTECPSWLYAVTMGATTVWERWDSLLPDGRVNGNGMTSFNHYALGAVADWLHRSVAGLAPAGPGYRRILVRPEPPASLARASARHLTPYGEAVVTWRRDGGRFFLAVDVPVGATAQVHLPGVEHPVDVEHGHHEWDVPDPVTVPSAPLTIRDVMDDDEIWPAVVEAATSSGVAAGGEVAVAAKLRAYLDSPASSLVSALAPPEAFAPAYDLEARLKRSVLSALSLGVIERVAVEGGAR